MNERVEVLLATMNQKDLHIAEEMNVQSPLVIANQCDAYGYAENADAGIRMISTSTRGVGINRNLALMHAREDILLFSDDDMVYYDGYEQMILDAYRELPDADMIIFGIDMYRDGKKIPSSARTQRVNVTNALKYGTCRYSIRRCAVLKADLHFSSLFGGGTQYSSGEDSLFLMDCLRAGLKVYTHHAVIAKNIRKPSTWFQGYNEKYFYDKGAWLACAFSCGRRLVQLYLGLRFRGMSTLGFFRRMQLMNAGIKGFPALRTYEEWRQQNA